MSTTDVSVLPTTIDALLTRWKARPSLAGVKIGTAPASDDQATEIVHLEDIGGWEIIHRSMGGGRPTVAREEDGPVPWVITVRSRTDAIDSLNRAMAITNELLLEIAENPQLGGTVTGLIAVTGDSLSVELEQAERKAKTTITMNLRVRGKLR
ncbi:MAG: hypothetical protein AAGA90_07935 [Actinomycetota bacterium]